MLTAVLVLAAPAAATTPLTEPERALFAAVNTARTTRGLQPLRVDRVLTRAARSHSHDLLASNRFEHGDVSDRMRRFGARAATLSAAADLYGVGSTQEVAVAAAWDAVNVH